MADPSSVDLRPLFTPGSIAVVGANEGNGFVKNLVKSNHELRFQLVNRRGAEVFGRATVPAVTELAEDVDLAVLSVPAEGVLPAMQDGVERGIKNYVIHSAGFGEAGAKGRERQDKLVRFARENEVRFLGPNCLGFANYVDPVPLHGAALPARLVGGNVGVVAQSGSASIVVMNCAREFEFSHVITTGNEALFTSEDVLDFLIRDASTDVIVMFIEALRDGQRFLTLAHEALQAGKPIIALKVGRSAAGKRVAMSHTGAIAGAHHIYEAAMTNAGIVQVYDFDELIQTTNLLAAHGVDAITRPAVIGISGGELGLVADVADDVGLVLPALSAETSEQLADLMVLGSGATVANPLDFGNGYSPKTFKESFEQAFRILEADQSVDGLVLVQDSQATLQEGYRHFYRQVTESFAGHVRATGGRFLHVSNVSEPHDEYIVEPLKDAGVLSIAGTRTALRAVKNGADYVRRARGTAVNSTAPAAKATASEAVRERLQCFVDARGSATETAYVPEYEALMLLAEFGLPVVKEATARHRDAAIAAAEAMGFPVVVKIWSDVVVHKAKAGGVALDLKSASEVGRAFEEMTEGISKRYPGAVQGVIVARQQRGVLEAILGCVQDETFGTFVLLGLGGGLVEALGQTTLFVPPRTLEEAEAHVSSSPLGPALRHLGIEPKQLADTVHRFGEIAEASRGLLGEFEINPLIIDRSGAHWAVDARMKIQERGEE